ncbi:hypothetical protein ScPMuIL_015117 [Solemya velum]
MENCRHLSRIRLAWNHSIVNPQKWLCSVCGTTESVWACLSCSNVACGRFNSEHALKHFQETKHPICIEVNERYVYCYDCDDYVLNDNAASDLKVLRSALSAIATQTFTDIESRGKRLLRSYSHTGLVSRSQAEADDKWATAIWHGRQYLLGKVLAAWQSYTKQEKKKKLKTPEKKRESPTVAPLSPPFKKRTLIPGVTGLRNLGNTCYMNSILQILGHLESFRYFFLKLQFEESSEQEDNTDKKTDCYTESPNNSTLTSEQTHSYFRQSTIECLEHLQDRKPVEPATSHRNRGGLNGGSSSHNPAVKLICNVESKGKSKDGISLCQEIQCLFRVLWSGRWAQVSPHAFLRAVWTSIPVFKGYAQHDAQEFLCELLDKIQNELNHVSSMKTTIIKPEAVLMSDIVNYSFQGKLISQVTCKSCGNISNTFEPFMDLSLEFPSRYQITRTNSSIAKDMCHVTEMLAKFTETECLEGKIYSCEKCNRRRKSSSSHGPAILTEAKKQLLVHKLPHFLRLHLKRFRWSGRLHREKICTHVAFNDVLDMKPFCNHSAESNECYNYKLLGVVIHHGRGIASGHYTAYTWNSEAQTWVHCNDSRLQISPLEDVLQSQAYILIYASGDISDDDGMKSLLSVPSIVSDSNSQTSMSMEASCSSSAEGTAVSSSPSQSPHTQEPSTSAQSIAHQVDEEISFVFQKPAMPKDQTKRKINTSESEENSHSMKRRRSTFW